MKQWIIGAVALTILVGGISYFWLGRQVTCLPPIKIQRLERLGETLHRDKGGGTRTKVTEGEELAVFFHELDVSKTGRAAYHKGGEVIVEVLEGKGKLHVGYFGEGEEVIWFEDLPIEEGDFFIIPQETPYQIKTTSKETLSYLAFGKLKTLQRERHFIRNDHPSARACEGFRQLRDEETSSETSQGN